jgi:hypothetical protein
MKLAFVLAAWLTLAGCAAVEYTQTDLVPLKRADRSSVREAADVAVVMYPVPAPTYNGYVDLRSINIREQTGIEAPLDRIRERMVTRLTGPLGYPAVLKRPPVMVASDNVEALRASVTAPLVLDFATRSWGLGNLRGGGEPKADDPIYVHHHVRSRLVRLSDGQILWQAVCGLRGYPGDETVKLSDLIATGGVLLRQKLATAADRCSDELVEFFQGAD